MLEQYMGHGTWQEVVAMSKQRVSNGKEQRAESLVPTGPSGTYLTGDFPNGFCSLDIDQFVRTEAD